MKMIKKLTRIVRRDPDRGTSQPIPPPRLVPSAPPPRLVPSAPPPRLVPSAPPPRLVPSAPPLSPAPSRPGREVLAEYAPTEEQTLDTVIARSITTHEAEQKENDSRGAALQNALAASLNEDQNGGDAELKRILAESLEMSEAHQNEVDSKDVALQNALAVSLNEGTMPR